MEISIKKPCHENWSDMTPNEQGAFCGKCVKTVIDFSSKSLEDIKAFFSSPQEDKVCGRFEKQQLTSLSFDAFFNEFKGLQFTKRFAVILYFTFGFWLFGSSDGMAQTHDRVKGDVAIVEPIQGAVLYKQPADTTKSRTKPEPRIMGKIAAPKQPKEKSTTSKRDVPVIKTATVAPVKKEKPKPQK